MSLAGGAAPAPVQQAGFEVASVYSQHLVHRGVRAAARWPSGLYVGLDVAKAFPVADGPPRVFAGTVTGYTVGAGDPKLLWLEVTFEDGEKQQYSGNQILEMVEFHEEQIGGAEPRTKRKRGEEPCEVNPVAVAKVFNGLLYDGVANYDGHDPDGNVFRVVFDDGDEETWREREFAEGAELARKTRRKKGRK
jgi:hypothetical protein